MLNKYMIKNIYIYLIIIIIIVIYLYKKSVNREMMTTRRRYIYPKGFSTTCIDLRFVDEGHRYLQKDVIGRDLYNTYVIPGASLGLRKIYKDGYEQYIDYDFFKAWKKALDISIAVNDIKKIVIIDHEDCEYYKRYYTINNGFDIDYIDVNPENRYNIHTQNMKITIEQLGKYLETTDVSDNPESELKILNPEATYDGIKIEAHIIKMDGGGEKVEEFIINKYAQVVSQNKIDDINPISPSAIVSTKTVNEQYYEIRNTIYDILNKSSQNSMDSSNKDYIIAEFNELSSNVDNLINFLETEGVNVRIAEYGLDDKKRNIISAIMDIDDKPDEGIDNFNTDYPDYKQTIDTLLIELDDRFSDNK